MGAADAAGVRLPREGVRDDDAATRCGPSSCPPTCAPRRRVDDRGRIDRPSRELRAEVFTRFRAALEPLREAGKLGGILMQFPSYVTLQAGVARVPGVGQGAARRRRDDGRVPPPQLARARDAPTTRSPSCASLGATYVMVDAPRTDARNLVPTVVATTSPTPRTCACTAATPPPGTCAAEAPPSGSTTCTRATSWRSGRSRCASSPRSRSAPTRCSTTTAAAPAPRAPIAQAPTNAHMLREHPAGRGVAVTDSPTISPEREQRRGRRRTPSGPASCAGPCSRTGPRCSARSISRSRW